MLEPDDIQKATDRETIERLSREVERLRAALLEIQAIKDEGSKKREIDIEPTDN